MTKTNNRLIIYILFLVIGAVLFFLAGTGRVDSFWSGMGSALFAISILRLFQINRYKKDSDYAEKMNIQNHDERNQWLSEKARSSAFTYSIVALSIGVIAARIMHKLELSTQLGMVVCFQVFLYWVLWFVLKKKY